MTEDEIVSFMQTLGEFAEQDLVSKASFEVCVQLMAERNRARAALADAEAALEEGQAVWAEAKGRELADKKKIADQQYIFFDPADISASAGWTSPSFTAKRGGIDFTGGV